MERAHEVRREPRADAGTVRINARDADGLAWVVEMYGMPLDLLRSRYGMSDSAARNMIARWRRGGWVETGTLGDVDVRSVLPRTGAMWVWATAAGVTRFGRHPYAANVPSAARVRHIRAAIETRIWIEERFAARSPEWRSERELRWEIGQRRGAEAARGHVPDAELEYTNPKTNERFRQAIEVELTPKAVDRTADIMRQLIHEGILGTPYEQVTYIVTPEAKPVVQRAREKLGASATKIDVRDLPAGV